MMFLVLAYAGIIIGITYLVYYHAVHNVSIFSSAGGGRNSAKGALVAYLAPLVAGVILVLFLIKPLFAKRVVFDKPRSLRQPDEPFLFAFVERVCQAVGAPTPSRIDVDCQVNAAASFRRGVWSMFGSDLVLTIGLPLVAGLNLQQFAGVLAHEFGHFSQGVGMRLSYFVRSLSFWFTRVVYQRDQWDQRLHDLTKTDYRLALFAYFAIVCVWVTRRVLWCLMMLGHLVSGFLMRQMEFDADKHEARLAGSQAFSSTQRQLRVLGVATQAAYADLNEFYKEGRLGDNLPLLIQAKVKQIPADMLQKVHAAADELKTGLFDTHPSDVERIASAQREQAPGLFQLTTPASALFANFAALSKTCTWDFYRGVFGDGFKLTDMHPVESLLERQDAEEATYKSLHRYFQGTFSTLRPVNLPSVWSEAPENPKETVATLNRLREELVSAAEKVKKLAERFSVADDRVIEADQAKVLVHAKLKFKPEAFHLTAATGDAVRQARSAATDEMGKLAPALEKVAEHNGRRLYSALQLMHVPQVSAKLPNAKAWRDQMNDLLQVAGLVGRQVSSLVELRNAYASFSLLLSKLEGNRENQVFVQAVISSMGRTWDLVRDVRQSLTQASYPFDHAHGEMKLESYVLTDMPHREDLGGVFEAAGRVLDRVPSLYAKVCARLAWMAEQVEQAVGLAPLPEPPEKDAVKPAEAAKSA